MTITRKMIGFKVLGFVLTLALLFIIIGCSTNENEDIAVTNIELSSQDARTTISVHAGTLQFTALVTPSNATNSDINYSVVNGTGSAVIDQNGLMTAVSNGLVTVKAESDSNSNITKEMIITISNQVTDNTAPLADEIATSKVNMNETMVGLSANEFVVDVQWILAIDKAAYNEAITLAEGILISGPLTDSEVIDAVNDLKDATILFNSKKENGNKVVLAIDLGSADDFVILSNSGVSTTGVTSIVGNIGVSPVSASYITGFGLIMDSGNTFSTSSLVTGQIFASDYQVDTPAYLTTAVDDMMIAYNDGMGRSNDYTELHTGDLSGKTLTSGVYMWSNEVLINLDLVLSGNENSVFIFKIAGTLSVSANTKITLTGGVLPQNIFWVVADTVAVDVGSQFKGVILSMTNVSFNTGSFIDGMIYAQTSVSLDAVTVKKV